MKLSWLALATLLLLALPLPTPGSASTIDLYATADVTHGRWWGYYGNGTWSDPQDKA